MVNRKPLKHLVIPESLGIGEGGKTLPKLYDYFQQVDNYIDELKNQSGSTNVKWENVENKPSSYPPEEHNHDGDYAPTNHNHDDQYANINHSHSEYASSDHNHDGTYAPVDHSHSEYAPADHNHDGDYAPTTHAHATDITAIETPGEATAEEIANKVNELIASLQG